MMAETRRSRSPLLRATILALSLTLAACGGGSGRDQAEEPDRGTGQSQVQPSDTSSPEAATRTVKHSLGTSEVPVDPQRVVVADRRGTLALLLELGIEPIAAVDATFHYGQPFHPLIADRAEAAGVIPLDATDGPPLEEVAAMEPDLIIGSVRDMGETADLLKEIAPTVGLDWDLADPLTNLTTIGEIVDRSEEAQTLVDEFDSRLEAAASESIDVGTVSIVGLFGPTDVRIYGSENLYGLMTERLGGELVPSAEMLGGDAFMTEISLEQISMARGDRLISFVNVAAAEEAAYRDLASEALVQSLPAFATSQVLEADPQLAFGSAGITGLTAMLEELMAFYRR